VKFLKSVRTVTQKGEEAEIVRSGAEMKEVIYSREISCYNMILYNFYSIFYVPELNNNASPTIILLMLI